MSEKEATKTKYHYGVGRRKRSTARAKIYPATELKIVVNNKDPKVYFSDYYYKVLENMMTQVGLSQGKIELFIKGGGAMGQAEAARLAIAKAMIAQDEGFRPILRVYDYLSTDIRKVLPKRSGLRKARKREQWSKR